MLGLGLAVGGLLRGYLALTDAGIYWPDEIYQSLEPAHRLVFGFGLLPWEFVEGARSWTLPGLVAGIWKGLALVGLGQAHLAVPALKLVFAGVGVGTGFATYRLARAYGASTLSAALGALAFCLAAPAIYFAPRAMSETACALPATLGLALALDSSSRAGKRVGGAALLALSVFLRLQCGVLCLGLLAILAARRAWRPLVECAATLAVGALLFGLVDRLTWGGWFHSAIVYLRFNLVEGRSAGWGTEDLFYYLRTLFDSMPLLALGTLSLAALGAWRARSLAILAALFLLVHMAVPHKELRFVFPLLPLVFALAPLGLDRLSGAPRRWGALALAVPAAYSAGTFHRLTFGDVGAYRERAGSSAYDDFGSVNRLLLAAGQRPDLCGLFVQVHLAWTGGYTYLDREIPLYGGAKPPPSGNSFNYAIARIPPQQPAVARDGAFALVKRFEGPCTPDPTYSWRLP